MPCPSAIGECRPSAWPGLRRQSCPVQVEHGLTLNDGSGGVDVCVVHEQFPLILHNQVRTTDAHLTDNLTELDQGTSLDDDTGEREVSWRRHHHIRPVFDQRRLEDDMRASSNEEVLDSGGMCVSRSDRRTPGGRYLLRRRHGNCTELVSR